MDNPLADVAYRFHSLYHSLFIVPPGLLRHLAELRKAGPAFYNNEHTVVSASNITPLIKSTRQPAVAARLFSFGMRQWNRRRSILFFYGKRDRYALAR